MPSSDQIPFTGEPIKVPCPKCGHEISIKIGGPEQEVVCSNCGATTSVSFDEAEIDEAKRTVIDPINKAIENLRSTFDRINRRIE